MAIAQERAWVVAALMLGGLFVVAPSLAQKPAESAGLASEMPAKVEPVTASFDYVRREVKIPMRDGVKLHTVIVVPKGAKGLPMLMTRTPYNAGERTSKSSSHFDVVAGPLYDGYIRVMQDVRGKYGSEGDYVMTRPLHGPLNPTPVDHSTDTYDTIDWLVKNVPESNGKVGILGVSYDGFTTLMALVNPHDDSLSAVVGGCAHSRMLTVLPFS